MREIRVVPRRDFRVPVEAEKISPDIFAPSPSRRSERSRSGRVTENRRS